MKKLIFILMLITSLVIAQNAAFADDDVWQMANSPKYGTKFGGMLGRGIVNIATSFVDIIVQTVDGTKTGPPFVGTLTGLGGGIGCAALRITSGAVDVLSFWVPGFNGIPVGRSYNNCLEEDASAPGSSADYQEPGVSEQVPAARQSNAMDYVKK